MEWIGIVEGIMGLSEGYSETDCTWFADPRAAQRHRINRAHMYASADDFQECHFEDNSILLEFSSGSLISNREAYWMGLHLVSCQPHSPLSDSILLWDQINSKHLFTAATQAEAINLCTLLATGRFGVKSDLQLFDDEVALITGEIFNGDCCFFDFEETSIHFFFVPRKTTGVAP